ncbi:MAG: tetratricopeptide repeat protein [Flavobacteriales bacterium]|nr:tetratricopeptide repeat protein [Flavobacteriales bacterium]NNK80357.1 tetratricopeptide repeat protein [Flavobacteriales bacterium]
MRNNHGYDNQNQDSSQSLVVQRYIKLLKEKRSGFFDVEEFGSIIDYYVNLFDLKEASMAIETGLLQHPESFEISLRKAHLALLSGKAEECLRILSGFELLNPNNEELLLLKAEAFSHQGSLDKAISLTEYLLSQETLFDRAVLYVQLANLHQQKGNYLDAIDAWKNAIELDEHLEMAHLSLRQAFITAEITEEGARYFKSLTDRRPFSAPAWVELAECYSHLEKSNEAILAFDYALAIEDEHVIALAGKGSAYFQNEDYIKALSVFKQLDSMLQEDPIVLCSIAECYEQLEDYSCANSYFLMALAIDPEHCESRLGHAIVSEHLGDSEKALRQMETVVGLSPDNSEYWFIYAELLSRNGQADKGQLCFERAIQLSEEQLDYFLGQIDALIRNDELAKALDKVQLIFEKFGDLESIYPRGIKVLFELGQKEEGLVLLEMLCDRHGGKDSLQEYYPDIFEDSDALQLLKLQQE